MIWIVTVVIIIGIMLSSTTGRKMLAGIAGVSAVVVSLVVMLMIHTNSDPTIDRQEAKLERQRVADCAKPLPPFPSYPGETASAYQGFKLIESAQCAGIAGSPRRVAH